MRMTRDQYRQANRELHKSNIEIKEEYLEKISKIVTSYLGKSNQIDNITDLFYDSMEDVYKNTTNKVHNIYPKAIDYRVEDLFTITYSSDGKTIEERIEAYWKTAAEIGGEDLQYAKVWLIDKYDMLLENEATIVESCIKKNKIKPIAEYLVIEHNCGCDCDICNGKEGVFPADEDIPLPPYHPHCSCENYYIEDVAEEVDEVEIILEE